MGNLTCPAIRQRRTFWLGSAPATSRRRRKSSTALPAGWSAWNSHDTAAPTAYYAEFHNTGPGANTSQRVPWSHQLTAKEAAAFEPQAFLRGDDHWNPVTEAAKLP